MDRIEQHCGRERAGKRPKRRGTDRIGRASDHPGSSAPELDKKAATLIDFYDDRNERCSVASVSSHLEHLPMSKKVIRLEAKLGILKGVSYVTKWESKTPGSPPEYTGNMR